jgi:AraC-like DNA-binding protein
MVNEAASWRPPSRFSPYLDVVAGYQQSGLAPAVHRGLPSPHLTMVIARDDGLHIASHSDPRQAADKYDAVVGGLHAAPVVLTHDGAWSGIQLSFTALGSRALLGLPAAALAEVDEHAADVLGAVAAQLRDDLLSQPDWRARFAVLEGWLDCRLDADVAMAAEVTEAWRLINATGGAAAISGIAETVGWSPRHLRAQFAAEIGLTPKTAARVVRFDRARHLLQARHRAGGAAELARLAATCGYADQAHLAREFRDLAGCSPTAWLAAEFPNVQAARVAPAAGSAA